MVLGTYANLYAFEEVSHTTEKTVTLLKINEKDLMSNELFIVKPPTTSKQVTTIYLTKLFINPLPLFFSYNFS